MDHITQLNDQLTTITERYPKETKLFAFVGLGFLVERAVRMGYSFYQYMIRPSRDIVNRYGDGWVIVTGASDGIGRSYVLEFARRGFKKIALVVRNPEKADKVVEDAMKLNPNLETKIVKFDFNLLYCESYLRDLQVKLE